MDPQRFRVAVDIGGTFTDIVFLDADGRRHTRKVSSSVDDYARAIVDGLRSVLTNPAMAAERRRKGIERAREFSWERSVAKTWAVYQTVGGRTALATKDAELREPVGR